MAIITADTPLGFELPPIARRFDVSMFAAGGMKTIHNDDEAARAEGLEGPVAVGPQVAALIFRMMGMCFDEGWIVGGRNAITFRRPVGVNDYCIARGVVRSKEAAGDNKIRVECDVWVETEKGDKAIVGTCSGLVQK
ncbi:MAG: MaoC family dehydratase [Proteobacteria bacterium]|nr:MaoC family dehydratase [Pseudomonadota bacterium]